MVGQYCYLRSLLESGSEAMTVVTSFPTGVSSAITKGSIFSTLVVVVMRIVLLRWFAFKVDVSESESQGTNLMLIGNFVNTKKKNQQQQQQQHEPGKLVVDISNGDVDRHSGGQLLLP